MVSTPVHVACYSGHTYAQEPRAFEWSGQRYQVERIVKRWRTPHGPVFRVEVAGDVQPGSALPARVDLTYWEAQDEWTLTVPT